MSLSVQEALVHLMVAAAVSSDARISASELQNIEILVVRLPVFAGYDAAQLGAHANACIDAINGSGGLEAALDQAVAAIPKRLHETAYALAVEVAAVDLDLPQEQLRLLEMLRDRLDVDRLVTAAIETSARARLRRI